MFGEAWMLFALLALAGGLIAGQPGLTALAALLLTVTGVARAWNRWALHGIDYTRRISERRAFLGETLTLELSLANRKLLPLPWLRVQDELPLQLTVLDAQVLPSAQETVGYLTSLLSLRWFERVSWRIHLRCDQRGFYCLGPAHLTSGDPFGLFRQQLTLPRQDMLVVYPRVYNLEALGLPAKEPFGDTRARLPIFEDPGRTAGVRDYGSGDPLKRVHWKATARRQQIQVRVYEPTIQLQLMVGLNTATLPHSWHGSDPELLEHLISVAASLASYGVEHKYQVGLLANGCWPRSDQPLKVLPGRSPYQLTHILEALAAITAMPTARFADLLLKESARLPWSATVAVVSGVTEDDLLEALLRLHAAGRRVALFSLAAQLPAEELPGIACYQLSRTSGQLSVVSGP